MRITLGSKLCLVMAVIVTIMVLATDAVFAHERRNVGNYGFAVGWIVEPAFEGQKNGVDLRVMDNATQKSVEGLEKTLKVEITHISSNTTSTFDLRTIFRDPGHYTKDLILTAPGDYRFRFTGSIDGSSIDQTFQSGPNTFGTVETSSQFPAAIPSGREMQSAITGAMNNARQAQDAAISAKSEASSARILAILGIVLGAIGIATGGAALVAAKRK